MRYRVQHPGDETLDRDVALLEWKGDLKAPQPDRILGLRQRVLALDEFDAVRSGRCRRSRADRRLPDRPSGTTRAAVPCAVPIPAAAQAPGARRPDVRAYGRPARAALPHHASVAAQTTASPSASSSRPMPISPKAPNRSTSWRVQRRTRLSQVSRAFMASPIAHAPGTGGVHRALAPESGVTPARPRAASCPRSASRKSSMAPLFLASAVMRTSCRCAEGSIDSRATLRAATDSSAPNSVAHGTCSSRWAAAVARAPRAS